MPDAYTQIPRSQNSEARLMAGVASAAVVSGELIIGLDDGRIIRAGYVQGPTGKTGPEGAIGATGQRGMDGNTILSAPKSPSRTLAKRATSSSIRAIGISTARKHRVNGAPAPTCWAPSTILKNGRDTTKRWWRYCPSNEGGGGGGTGTVFSNNVFLSGTGRAIDAPGGNIIPEGKSLSVQSNLNKWIENSLRALDTLYRSQSSTLCQDKGGYQGDIVLFEGALCVGRR